VYIKSKNIAIKRLQGKIPTSRHRMVATSGLTSPSRPAGTWKRLRMNILSYFSIAFCTKLASYAKAKVVFVLISNRRGYLKSKFFRTSTIIVRTMNNTCIAASRRCKGRLSTLTLLYMEQWAVAPNDSSAYAGARLRACNSYAALAGVQSLNRFYFCQKVCLLVNYKQLSLLSVFVLRI